PPESIVIRAGSPDVELARVASTATTGLIVLGGRADGDSSSPGHVARFVARNATAPVVVTSPPAPSRRVVAASDLRDERYPVLRAAAALAVALGARATAMHNVEASAGEPTGSSERLLEGVARSACFDEALVTREPSAPRGISSIARQTDADVLVVGVRPYGGETFASVLASESRTVVAVPIAS
ncbi:MAG TPA: hypothetical protein VIF62_27780, partial [Labilithrix sp.]